MASKIAALAVAFITMTGDLTMCNASTQEVLEEQPVFQLANRRYIGCKQKLLDWMFEKIKSHAPDARTFFDVFAGTGVVSERAIKEGYESVIMNDFLWSNNVIYEGMFADGDVDEAKLAKIVEEYNSLDGANLSANYFSENFGGKYFEDGLARMAGYIRADIEIRKSDLTDKEANVLLASLIYSIDAHANTCGHYEAYIRRPIVHKDFKFRLVDFKRIPSVRIYREDSNVLARKVRADVAYVDPPYNSRQYSRFYHVYETLVKWDMAELTGVARKPAPENMSEYCRSNAIDAFRDLIENLDCKYIVVSYNNTYSSKSKSSENKISIEELKDVLERVGKTTIYTHKHTFFNTGKTEFPDHLEYLFITEKERTDRTFSRSPFFYVGDKYKLLSSIIGEFPDNISRFVEPFVGGGSVFLNVDASEYLLNDGDKNIVALHRHLCEQAGRQQEWSEELYAMICGYGLSRSYWEDVIPVAMKKEFVKTYYARYNKSAYERLRNDYNMSNKSDKESLDRLYLLLIYGFNRMLRYNRSGNFNLPVGNVDFNNNVAAALRTYMDYVSCRRIRFCDVDFEDFLNSLKLTPKDFVYLDPPYLITGSEYNKMWSEQSDERLMNVLDRLNAQGIRFAVSNVTHYQGRENAKFREWSRKYRVVPIKSRYINYHDNSDKNIEEVLVVNYEK